MLNNPINLNDPTGHVECEPGTDCRPPGSVSTGGAKIDIKTKPPCKDADACGVAMGLIGYLLAANIVTDLIVVLVFVELLSNPIGWITLAAIVIMAIVATPFFYETYRDIQDIMEFKEWRDYYKVASE